MRKLMVFVSLAAVLLCGNASAQTGDYELGVILGEPTGLSAKLWTGDTTAIDGALAWSTGRDNNDNLYFHADYLIHNFNLIKVEEGKLPLYYGVGGKFRLRHDTSAASDDFRTGVRIPVGLDYIFKGGKVDIFFEIVPVFIIAPDSDFDINSGLGIRYHF
ncbi:hypothetical protein KJ959_00545 [bacterium]|nr:hypothetical protein [Candidatus Omnitrophota bacterium]MBU3930677.1 hypothetical protein [bacterium]MBU4122155.1 hypothetical protein [bacterium]